MPENNATTTGNALSPTVGAAAGAGVPWIGKLAVALFLGAVVLAECIVAYLCVPDAADTLALASTVVAAQPGDESVATPKTEDRSANQIEVDLEQFSVTAFQPVSNTTLRIDFHLYGAIAVDDEVEFQQRMAKNVHRFREQVIVIIRSAELTDLTDAGLGLIKRKILEKTNHILGKPLLKSVIVSDFSFIEQ